MKPGKEEAKLFSVKRKTEPPAADVNALVALYNARRYAEAESRTRALLGEYPDFGFGWKLLGGILQKQGKDALPALQNVVKLMPEDAEAHLNLGVALRNLGRLDQAMVSYQRAIQLKPNYAEAHSSLGNTLKDMGRLDEAVASYRRALKIKPDWADAHNNLGTAFKGLGQLNEAVASYRKAVELKPDFALAYYNLGNGQKDLGQLNDAVASYRRAVEIKPDFAGAYYNLGNAQKYLGQPGEAASSYRRALEIKPDFAEALNNLGTVLQTQGQLDPALASYRNALQIKPDFAEAYNNLGFALKEIGQFDAALANFRRALEVKPDYAEAYNNLLFSLNYTNHSPEYCLEEALKYGRMVRERVTSRFSSWQCEAQPQRLRVGIVSGDLRNHPVGFFLESMLGNIDPARIELIAYPTVMQFDAVTDRLKPHFSAWKPLFNLSDEAAAHLIHDDGVHVLLDLSGHTAKNRLAVFAWKPAPVQAGWLGYFGTTGVAEMDYILADAVSVTEAQRVHFSEAVWHLDALTCLTPPDVDLSVTTLPALANGYVIFGSFQRLDKVRDEVLAAWAEIFTALPNARMRLQSKQLGNPAMVQLFSHRLQLYGINPARVMMHGATSRETYLAAYGEVDILLDTFPYTGATTTCEALWMGVPTLTLAGITLLARVGASVLASAGLKEWVATSVADYVDKAVMLAGDIPKLAALRTGLRQQALASPIFDAPRFARNFENALWGMWLARAQKNAATSSRVADRPA